MIKPACELGDCSYLDLDKMDVETRQYIFRKCGESLIARLKHDPNFNKSECPQAALTAAVITNLAVREGEFEVPEE